MQKLTALLVLFILNLTTTACGFDAGQSVSFQVVEEGSALLVTGDMSVSAPSIIVIAAPQEIVAPDFGLDFPETTKEYLKQLNYSQSFAVLTLRGQMKDSGTIKEVVRQGNRVIINARPYNIGPGNYVVKGFTQPYEVISIIKQGEWNRNIHFVLERENDGVICEIDHFIP